MRQKRIVAIHDISCLGRCSITIALPVLSAAGIETAVMPTSILSTHTGGFKEVTFRDLSDDIPEIAKHWIKEGISFDAIYTGYLCSERQINIIDETIKSLSHDKTIIITDPVMGDNGKLYSGFSEEYPSYMLKLCKNAHIITPNITEAVLMLGIKYPKFGYTKEFISGILIKLYNKTHAYVILTGISFDDDKLGVGIYDGEKSSFLFTEKLKTSYHGTGDLFTSSFIGAYLRGYSLIDSSEIAIEFVKDCIIKTVNDKIEERFGVEFETELPKYIDYLEKSHE